MPDNHTTVELQGEELPPYLPNITLDCVILGYHEGLLKVLLLQWKNTEEWSLPRGQIRKDESLDDAARKIVVQRTALQQLFLHQFHVFGDVEQKGQGETKEKLEHIVAPIQWAERSISVGYYALVDYEKTKPKPDNYTDLCKWWDVKNLPRMLFNHKQVVEYSLNALQLHVSSLPIGNFLLPEQFTLPEFQRLYETILGKTLDPRNFQRKILSLGILNRLDVQRKGGAHKAPYLYQFNKDIYETVLLEKGLLFS